jgi:hypothetical protein
MDVRWVAAGDACGGSVCADVLVEFGDGAGEQAVRPSDAESATKIIRLDAILTPN